MVFQRVKSTDWTVNSLLTSTQITNMDKQLVKAIDKTGETLSGGGGVTGTIDWLSGSAIVIRSGATVTFNSGSSLVIATGATLQSTLTVSGAGSFILQSGSTFNLQSGAAINLASGSGIDAASGSTSTFAGGSTVVFDNNSTLRSEHQATNALLGRFVVNTTTLGAAGSTYTIDSGGYYDTFVLVNTSTTAKTLTLPTAVNGRLLVITDSTGNAGTNNITLAPPSGTINGTVSYTMSNARQSVHLLCDGTNWFITAKY